MPDITTMNRRTFLAGTTALGALGITGAARAQDITIPAPIADIPTDAPMRWIDTGDQKAVFYRDFFARYTAERGVDVVYDGLPWSELNTVVPLGIRNGTAQDAFVLPSSVPPAFAVRDGWVQPYDGLIPDLEAWKGNFPDGSFIEGLNVFEGKTYGVPYTSALVSGAHLLFNRDMMANAGFDPEAQPLTWDGFREAARKITESAGGRAYGFIIGGAQVGRWSEVVRTLGQMAGAACGKVSIAAGVDFRTGKVIWNADEFVAAVELLLAMNDDGSVFPGSLSMTAPQARAFMPQGAAGMILQGPWNIPVWERENPDFNFGIAPPPAPEGATGKIITGELAEPGNTMFINAKAKNPLAVADVVHYLGTVEGQTAWANVVGPSDPPLFPEALERSSMSKRSTAVLSMFRDIVRVGPNPFARNPELSEVAKAYVEPTPSLASTVQGLFAGQLTGVRENLDILTEATEAALDKAFDEARANGANVSRDDMVFPNWDPARNYVAADYAEL
ncbi:ABC transporter substrate-binding protein [Oceaniglobus trochenteri]|uniref:ABC transporter substrate-binding protein n=1 Tax=Oceaniglobus trochenteri TaxID=2763260 RepID=UPI001CFFDD76|nr:extracellular solute-binding protein [Oceaniglobus trochenteri]